MEVQLGEHTVTVVAQPFPYLEDRLGKYLGQVSNLAGSGELSGESIVGEIWDNAHEVLCVLVPELKAKMPLYEWEGYPSKEAKDQEAERSDADFAKAPTFPQIVGAFEAIIQVNRFDELKRVTELGGKVLEQFGISSEDLAKAMDAVQSEQSSTTPSPNGGSASTTPSETSPTSPKSAD